VPKTYFGESVNLHRLATINAVLRAQQKTVAVAANWWWNAEDDSNLLTAQGVQGWPDGGLSASSRSPTMIPQTRPTAYSSRSAPT